MLSGSSAHGAEASAILSSLTLGLVSISNPLEVSVNHSPGDILFSATTSISISSGVSASERLKFPSLHP